MHISCLYCSGYASDATITGHIDVITEHGQIRVNFNEEECKKLQDIATDAYLRKQQDLIRELQENVPGPRLLSPPSNSEGDEAEFHPFVEDGVPF